MLVSLFLEPRSQTPVDARHYSHSRKEKHRSNINDSTLQIKVKIIIEDRQESGELPLDLRLIPDQSV